MLTKPNAHQNGELKRATHPPAPPPTHPRTPKYNVEAYGFQGNFTWDIHLNIVFGGCGGGGPIKINPTGVGTF